MRPDRFQPPDNDHDVVPFRPRSAGASGRPWSLRAEKPAGPAVEGLAKYEGGEVEDNYRHRMMVNVAGLLVTVVLAIAGVWLAIQIADMRKNQDCFLSGRRNCTPIEIKALER